MSGGGSVGPVGQVIGQVNAANAQPNNTGGAAYTPIKQGPVYQPQYQAYQPQQRFAQPQQMPNYQSGLQAAMMQMMQQYSRPMMRAPMQQGLMPYNSPALNYRPPAVNNTSRVAPSVEVQQKQAAEEAARQAAIDAANAPQGGNE